MIKVGVLFDGFCCLGGELVLDEGVGDVVVFLFEDQTLDCPELLEFAADVFLLDLEIAGQGTVLLMLEM